MNKLYAGILGIMMILGVIKGQEINFPTLSIPYDRNYFGSNPKYWRNLNQWGLKNDGMGTYAYTQAGTTNYFEPALLRADIHIQEAWALRPHASNVVVAVIDDGVTISHPVFAGNIWTNPGPYYSETVRDSNGISFVYGRIGTSINSSQGHGTQVASVIAGNGYKGFYGVVPRVQIMPVRAVTPNDNVLAIHYALDHHADILNCSWGFEIDIPGLREALERARDMGVLCVFAAPNRMIDVDNENCYPASYRLPNVIVVTSSTPMDTLYTAAGYGFTTVDLMAPGRLIITAFPFGNDELMYSGGTSLATPHVSGTLALLKAHYPQETYMQLKDRLLSSVDLIPQVSGMIRSGGRLNAYKALTYIPPRLTVHHDCVRLTTQSILPQKIETSTNLVNWTPFTETDTTTDFPFENEGMRVFRLVK